MNVISAALDEIAARAKDADRGVVDMLHGQLKALDAGAKAAISLGTLSDIDLVETGEARRRALDALDATSNVIMRRQLALIGAVPADRPECGALTPMSAPALLFTSLDLGIREIEGLMRDEAAVFETVIDGAVKAAVRSGDVQADVDELIVYGVGRWPTARIEAVGDEGGLAVLLDDGTHIAVRRAD